MTHAAQLRANGRAVAGLFTAEFFVFGIGVYSFTQFLVPISRELGWGRGALGGMMSFFWMAAPAALVVSRAVRRIDPRWLALTGGLIEAVGLALMATTSNPTELYVLRFVMGVGKVLTATTIPIAAARWFSANAGVVLGVSLSGCHLGGLVFAPLATYLIATGGWRNAAWEMAVLDIVGICLAAVLLSDPRGDTGQEAMDQPATRPGAAQPHAPGERQRARAGSLAAIAVGTIAFYAGYAGLLSHLAPLLADAGYASREIGRAMGSVAMFAAVGVLVCGAATRYLRPQLSGALMLSLMALLGISAMLLRSSAGVEPMIAVIVLLGFVLGGGDPIIIDALRQSVPAHRFSDFYGWWYLTCLVTLAAAPILAGLAFDHYGTYRVACLILAAVTLLAAVAWLILVKGGARSEGRLGA